MTRLLGAVLAGGRSSRFGSDKALALWRGRTLLDHALDLLAPHVADVVICGRAGGIPDQPAGGLGPLAGLNAALHHGREGRYDAVLTLACDTPWIAPALLERLRLTEAPAYVAGTPVIGLWPCALADALDAHVRGEDRSMRGWIRAIGGRPISVSGTIPNINTPADLADLDRNML